MSRRRTSRRSAGGNAIYMGAVAVMDSRSVDSNYRDNNNICQCTHPQIAELRRLLECENVNIAVSQAAFLLQRSWNNVPAALKNVLYRGMIDENTYNNILDNIITNGEDREMDIKDGENNGNDDGSNISSGKNNNNNNNNNVVNIEGRGDNNSEDERNTRKVKFGRTPSSKIKDGIEDGIEDGDEELGRVSITGGTTHQARTRRRGKGNETVRIMITGIQCKPEHKQVCYVLFSLIS